MTDPAPIVAAGAVVLRKGPEVLLVHRPKYDDWSFPKGKLDPGEHVTTAAVREVAEETGLDVRLGPPLPLQRYLVRNGTLREKLVHYWVARTVGDDDVSTYEPNPEIDDVEWVPLDVAERVLSYPRDREVLDAVGPLRKKTVPLVVLRHAKAVPRKAWDGEDTKRPLDARGVAQADHVALLLQAYGVRRALSSTSRRCRATLRPYVDPAGVEVETLEELSEEKAAPRRVERVVQGLVDGHEPAVVCTHRPVLPYLWEALGVRPTALAAGALLVVHHRRGRVVAVEHHSA
jgi:8-oxo-dGTP pyrophosphatase MutT (NUDIX family)/phosphohistidine phosphatase SixA